MGKKAWIIFGIVCIVIVVIVLVLLLVLVPQVKSTVTQAGNYEAIAKQEYTFDGTEIDKLKKQYNVTENDVSKGKNTNKYEEGNINPFTPKTEVTIYNEPTLENENKTGSEALTPERK